MAASWANLAADLSPAVQELISCKMLHMPASIYVSSCGSEMIFFSDPALSLTLDPDLDPSRFQKAFLTLNLTFTCPK